MAEARNESSGLKIALSAFITLSVILSVASYFLYSSYSSSMTEIANLKAQVQRIQDECAREKDRLRTIIRELRDKAEKEARLDGVRTMPLGRLLNVLGYDINIPAIGRVDKVNRIEGTKRTPRASKPM